MSRVIIGSPLFNHSHDVAVAIDSIVGQTFTDFALAHERHPEAEYFAWTSDHDLWHPCWLERLVETLDAHADVVLGYPGRHAGAPQPSGAPFPDGQENP